ncbi:hypothetical protein GCM10023091_42000 [Ravibacter arvi]|uniref:Uncharacterized protein n=1 Tax=Ravibacter arvi TaxID=2051041 RepID=A0ABP8MAA9_9BACT
MDSKANNERLDELFRSKLETFETLAGDRAWEKLQKAQRPASRFPAPTRWIAAAVVAGVCLAAGFWFGIEREEEAMLTAADAPVRKENTGRLEEKEKAAPAENGIQAVVSEHERKDETAQTMAAEEKREKEVVVSSRKGSGAKDSVSPPVELPQPVPSDSGKLNTPVGATGEPATRVLVVYVTPVPLDETPAMEKEPEIVAQAAAVEEAPVKKKRGIQRFFKQLRNAKTGEKVDWEELGLSPQKTYANVETPVGSRQQHYQKKGN